MSPLTTTELFDCIFIKCGHPISMSLNAFLCDIGEEIILEIDNDRIMP